MEHESKIIDINDRGKYLAEADDNEIILDEVVSAEDGSEQKMEPRELFALQQEKLLSPRFLEISCLEKVTIENYLFLLAQKFSAKQYLAKDSFPLVVMPCNILPLQHKLKLLGIGISDVPNTLASMPLDPIYFAENDELSRPVGYPYLINCIRYGKIGASTKTKRFIRSLGISRLAKYSDTLYMDIHETLMYCWYFDIPGELAIIGSRYHALNGKRYVPTIINQGKYVFTLMAKHEAKKLPSLLCRERIL